MGARQRAGERRANVRTQAGWRKIDETARAHRMFLHDLLLSIRRPMTIAVEHVDEPERYAGR